MLHACDTLICNRSSPPLAEHSSTHARMSRLLLGMSTGYWIDTAQGRRCELMEGAEEGVTAMDQGCVRLEGCHIHSNKGPGLDISGQAAAIASNCSLHDNIGTA